MSVEHKVIQGEHISGIALLYGYADYMSVWKHPDNAALRERRKTPNILLAGDIVSIPDRQEKTIACPTDCRHEFRIDGTSLMLRLKLQQSYGQPLSGTSCDL